VEALRVKIEKTPINEEDEQEILELIKWMEHGCRIKLRLYWHFNSDFKDCGCCHVEAING